MNNDGGPNNEGGIHGQLTGERLSTSQKHTPSSSSSSSPGAGGLSGEPCSAARTRPDTGAEAFIISQAQTPALFPCWTALFAHSRPDVSAVTGHSRLLPPPLDSSSVSDATLGGQFLQVEFLALIYKKNVAILMKCGLPARRRFPRCLVPCHHFPWSVSREGVCLCVHAYLVVYTRDVNYQLSINW